MGEWLGMIAGGGMLILIGTLMLLFLHQLHLLPMERVRRILSAFVLTAAIGMLYFLAGALIRQAACQDAKSPAAYNAFFRAGYLLQMYDLLAQPAWRGVLTGAFAYAAHGVGKLLLGQYLAAGAALSWGLTWLSVCFARAGLRKAYGEQAARDGAFLLLCAPGAVFFFLPGWPPLALLLCSFAFYLLAALRAKGKKNMLPRTAFWLILVFLSVLSAAVTAALALGRIP